MGTSTDYEAPMLLVIGSASALTNEGCLFEKSHGKPDYTMHMHPGGQHITNCSS